MPEDAAAVPDVVCHAEAAHRRAVLVDWSVGNACNHACSYCPAALHDGSLGWQEADAMIRLMDDLARHYGGTLGRVVWCQFTGGEPTMHPAIVPLLHAAADRGIRTSLISNGGRTFRFWERIFGLLESVVLTYHDEFVDHGHFRDVAELLSAAMPVHVNVTVHPTRFDDILARADDIARAAPDATVTLKPLRVGFGERLYPYTDAQRARLGQIEGDREGRGEAAPRGAMLAVAADGTWVVKRANDFILEGRNRWPGYLCDAGLESLRIRADGRVFRAVCGEGGEIGRLGGRIALPLAPVVCGRSACTCVSDILITKRRPEAEAALHGLAG